MSGCLNSPNFRAAALSAPLIDFAESSEVANRDAYTSIFCINSKYPSTEESCRCSSHSSSRSMRRHREIVSLAGLWPKCFVPVNQLLNSSLLSLKERGFLSVSVIAIALISQRVEDSAMMSKERAKCPET